MEYEAQGTDSSDISGAERGHAPGRMRVDSWLAVGLGLVAFLIYFKTLCPTIYTDDCGEIATAVATGGVAHPPGYPFYCLIGAVFVKLIPLGEPAWRLGLLSSLSAAAAVALAYLLARRLGAGAVWAAIGALALAFSYTLWQQATKVETYALNAFFVALLLTLAVAYSQTGKRALFVGMAAAGGLALTNHLTILWLIPALLWIAVPTLFAVERRPWRALAGGVAVCLAMLLLYGYEVFAAKAHPGGQVWGDPDTARRLYLQVTGARYQDYFTHLGAFGMLHRDFVYAPAWLWRNTGWMLPFSAAGLAALWRGAGRRFAQGLLLVIAGYLACNTLYGIDNIFEYYTPVVIALCALGAVGLEWAAAQLAAKSGARSSGRLTALAAAAALIGLALVPAGANWRLCDRSRETFVRTLALDTLSTLPPDSVLVVSGDNRIFPLWYAQDVLGVRRDVLVLPRDFLWDLDTPAGRQTDLWYLNKLAARNPAIRPGALLARCAVDRAYALSDGPIWQIAREMFLTGRPVFIGEVVPGDLARVGNRAGVLRWIGLPVTPTPYGLCYRLAPADHPPTLRQALMENLALETRLHIRLVAPDIFVGEPDGPFSNILYARCLTQTGEMLLSCKRDADAYAQLCAAAALAPKSGQAADDLAIACMGTGRTDQALLSWRRAIALDPASSVYRANLATALKEIARAGGPPEN